MAKKKNDGDRRGQPPLEVPVVGELDDELETDIVNALLDAEPGEEITLYFDSGGGSMYAAIAIATLLSRRRIKATGIVLGECSSATLLIFAACKRRLVSPLSVFLFHRIRWRNERDFRGEEAVEWSKHFLWLEQEVDRRQAAMFGIAPAKLAEWTNNGAFVLGGELATLGVAELMEW